MRASLTQGAVKLRWAPHQTQGCLERPTDGRVAPLVFQRAPALPNTDGYIQLVKYVLVATLLALLCTSCDLQGLDLNTPSDARRYVQACGRGTDAIHCRAIQRVLTRVTGAVTVLLPNTGDHAIRASLEAYVRATGRSPEAFEQSAVGETYAKANIFPAAKLQTGTMTTLDGKAHTVICEKDDPEREVCTIDGMLSAGNRLQGFKDAVGSIYATYNLKAQAAESAYLAF